PNDSFVPDYLYYNLDIRYSELRKLSTGDGGRGGLNLTLIRAVEIPFPPTIDEQRQIVHIFNDMDKEIEKLKTQRTKYQQLKTGMMQELLTGKKRLV
ncbi:Type I restriction modification DNA specificity domain-containing protein, partial [Candidatus Electrothrix marina]